MMKVSKRHWSQWSGYVAALWSLAYGVLGLYWLLGGAGVPFGREHDAGSEESLLGWVPAQNTVFVVVVLGVLGALIALMMARGYGSGGMRLLLISVGYIFAAALLIVIPDRRVLMAVAYAPIFLVGAPFHWPPISFLKAIPWPVINQMILMLGGALWAMGTLSYQRRSRGACEYCGRSSDAPGTRRFSGWDKWAVAIAVIIPVIYSATRWAWALGIPLGISEQFLREGQQTGLWLAGAALGSVAVGGAILTLGLVQHWGEVFPRWMLGLAGKRVPPMLAVIPALSVAAIVTSGGLAYVRIALIQAINFNESWTTIGPELLWPIWGVALAAATLAYYYRRRGTCKHCGLG